MTGYLASSGPHTPNALKSSISLIDQYSEDAQLIHLSPLTHHPNLTDEATKAPKASP